MKAIGRILRLGRIGKQGRQRLDGRRGIMRFGLDTNRSRDEGGKPIGFDTSLGHPGFLAGIDPDRRFSAIIAGIASPIAAVFLVAAAAIAFLIGPLLVI